MEQEQKAELERQAQELAEKKRLEEEAQRRINELEEENALENDQYRSVEEEIELKTRKLKRLFQTYKKVKVDVEDMRAEFQKDKEAMLDDIQALTQQIKLKNLVLDSFVPPSALEAMMALSTWNEHEQSYVVVRFDVAGNAIRRPPGTPGVGTTGRARGAAWLPPSASAPLAAASCVRVTSSPGSRDSAPPPFRLSAAPPGTWRGTWRSRATRKRTRGRSGCGRSCACAGRPLQAAPPPPDCARRCRTLLRSA